MNKLLTILITVTLIGCGSAGYDSSDDDDDSGNVGFGGAQDIGQFRNILEAGGIPGEETLDANGFFNEHYVPLPDADCGQVVCGHGMLAVGLDWTTKDYQAALQISMNSPISPDDLERLPLNLVVVVDTSGSMASDERLEYVKQGLHLLIDELEEGDRIALVEYNTDVEILATLDNEADRETLHGIVSGMYPSGLTNLYAGLQTGMQMVSDDFDPARQNRVILLSDGQPTAGITDDYSIIEMANGYIGDGIGLTTIGVGLDFNVDLMRGLAERGAGNFYFLEDADAINEVFTEELDYFVTPIALGLEIEMTAGSDYTLGDVVGTRLWEPMENGGRVHIPAVFLSSRTSSGGPDGKRGGGSAIFVRMHPRAGASDNRVAYIRLTYRLPDSGEQIQQDIEVINPTDPGLTPEEAFFSHQAMAKNYAVYNVFLGLREATRRAANDYSCALAGLEDLEAKLSSWSEGYEDTDLIADLALIQMFASNLREQGANSGWCYGYDDEYYDDEYYDDDMHYQHCSAASGRSTAGMALMLLLALALIPRRRRSK